MLILPVRGTYLLILLAILVSGCLSPIPQPPGNGNNGNGGTTPPLFMGWLAYRPVQAQTNPWQVAGIQCFEGCTEPLQVSGWLEKLNVNYSTVAFIPYNETVCEALNCPRGDYLVVQPADEASRTILESEGFFPFDEPFVYVLPKGNGEYAVTLVNASNEIISFGGCNEFIPEKITPNGNIPIPPKVCVWEGIPTILPGNGKTNTFTWQPTQVGNYRVALEYGTDCQPNQPLSQAQCAKIQTIHSQPFDVRSLVNDQLVIMRYAIKQCHTNPWQDPMEEGQVFDQAQDQQGFEEWISPNGLHATQISFIPAPENFVACLACSCPTGSHYEIVVSREEQSFAETLGFIFYRSLAQASPITPPEYGLATWFVYTPFRCYANSWNNTKDPVHSVEKDMGNMKKWLENQGVKTTYMTFIRGVSLSQECTKKTTDTYGIGILDPESVTLLESLLFVQAGKTQFDVFTQTNNQSPAQLLYKTKFCALPPWGQPDLTSGNEAGVAQRVQAWLSENGIESLEPISIHRTPPSFSGTCDTDSGLGVLITVPAWSETHLGAYGFLKPSTTFDEEESKVYPLEI